ncbi:hypothetical protein MBRA1_002759 [Malassezia brasiliensis]|uniref:Transcription initiation factor TFIID subunit 4 n=1 Tax=Malassezia brasiliensis TaxID=1821822 RepID=A0AAF0DU31_9BASI|nr:hypothetical protein MBRA1_002759 [Malassezia brasiliensis]
MEKREGERSSARQAKKIKTEHANDAQEATHSKPNASTPHKPPARSRKAATPPNAEPVPLTAAAAAPNAPRRDAPEANAARGSPAPNAGASSTPAPAPAEAARPTTSTPAPAPLSNLDRLASIANSQRSDAGTPLNYRMDTSLLATPTGGGAGSAHLPLSLQRLQAMRNAQASPTTGTPAGANTSGAQNASGFDHLVDVLGFSGVDLRAEEAFIQQSSFWEDANQAANAALSNAGSAQGLYLNVYPLSAIVHRVAKQYGLKVDPAALDYLSIATRMRFRNLLEAMVRVSRHRAWSSHQRAAPVDEQGVPLYHEELTSNPGKQLAAIEKAERIEEGNWRRMRLEREEAEAAAQEAAAADDGSGTPGGAKRGKRPVGTSGRNLSEDVRKRLADSTAMRHLGANNVASKYAWLQSPGMRATPRAPPREPDDAGDTRAPAAPAPGLAAGALPKPKFAPQTPAPGTRLAPSQGHAGVWSDVATRQAAQKEQERAAKARVTLRDALAALEREDAGGAGRGSGRRSVYLARAWGRGRRG